MIVNHTVPNNEAILRRTLRIAYCIHRDDAVKEIIIEGKKSVFPVLPREHMPTIVYVRMANLPIHIVEEGSRIVSRPTGATTERSWT